MSGKLVCLDPGHGGKDPGGCGNGLQEKNLVLDIALKTRDLLRPRGIDVLMTRETDVYLSISARYDAANKAQADLFISIHTDAYYESAHGFSLLWYKAAYRDTIGMLMKDELLAVDDDWNRWIYGNYVGVLLHTNMPALLTENTFITNADDASKLAQPSYRQKLAEAHAKAICKYFNVPYDMTEGSDENMAIYMFQEQEKQGENFVWAAPDAFTKNNLFATVDCWLNIYNENDFPVEVLLWCNHDDNKEKWPLSIPLDKWKRTSINLKNVVGEQYGFSCIMKCTSKNVPASITILCK